MVGALDVAQLVRTLEGLGYKCEMPGSLRGMSGIAHVFDIVARGNGMRVVVQLLSPGNTDYNFTKAIAFRTKAYDCSPDLAVMISPTKASDQLKEISNFYRFALIESCETSDICEGLTKLLNEC